MNPAVSLALALTGKFPPRSLLHYLPAQYLGAWLGSALVLLTYRDAILHFYSGAESQDWAMDTAGIFVTSPAAGVSNLGGAIDQVSRHSSLLITPSLLIMTSLITPDSSSPHHAITPHSSS